MTLTTQLVLRAILADPGAEHYGLEVCRATGLASGTVHPILGRLEGHGWLTSAREEVDPSLVGRPQRRLYKLTRDGMVEAMGALATVRSPIHLPPCRSGLVDTFDKLSR
jgi:DNA-binding MarR family transcriptional regulator